MATTALQSSQALKDFKQKMDELNIPFCLFLGTSLGAYRDGTFCPGDEDDIDVAVDIKYFSRLDDIRNGLREFNNWQSWVPEDGLCPEISFKRDYGNGDYSKIDIFFISEIGKQLAWRFYTDLTGKQYITKYFNKKHFENFCKVNFFGTEYNVPGEIEEYLESNYGDWKTPIHRKDWNWRTDNKCPDNKLVSIVIPVWGEYAKFLPECLESIKQQTYKDFEIIIVDNKTDLPSARNEGIKKANGSWILPLDVDDKILPTCLEKMMTGDDIVAVGIVDSCGHEFMPPDNVEYSKLKEGNSIIACSLFKKKVWDEIGGYDESMVDGYEDWDFWLRAMKHGYKVKTILEPLYYMRRHADSMINETVKKHEEIKNYILSK